MGKEEKRVGWSRGEKQKREKKTNIEEEREWTRLERRKVQEKSGKEEGRRRR